MGRVGMVDYSDLPLLLNGGVNSGPKTGPEIIHYPQAGLQQHRIKSPSQTVFCLLRPRPLGYAPIS